MTAQETKLKEAFEIAQELLDYLDIEYGDVEQLEINTRAKRRWGQCSYNRYTGKFKISISSKLLGEDEKSEKGLLNTVVHELLHTCKGCQNHGSHWKNLADKVNAEFDLGIKRCDSAKDKGVEDDYEPAPIKYQIKCPVCGHIYNRRKMCYPVKHPENCGCTHCGHWGLELL